MIDIRRLRWNPGNVAHIARHGITKEEVEQVCHEAPVVQIGKLGRSLVFGPTTEGRIPTVVLDPDAEPGFFFPVTARPASRPERAIYARERREQSND